ncbi:DUF4264 family protein [Ectobacillus polymachus]|uniref:DUF4264 family protein n=1 Tax=Ectobacillus polymachus TaxID=1508806 RepID=UPI003A83813A
MDKKIEVLSTTRVYKIVDGLNRTLKEKDFLFGLALDENEKNQEILTIYRT